MKMNADHLADNFRETHGLSDEAVPALSALLRTYAASRLREAAGELRATGSVPLAGALPTTVRESAQTFADWLAERAAQEERG